MVKIINYKDKNFTSEIVKILQQNSQASTDLSGKVADIINSVRKNGDAAIIDICNKFDGANFKNADDLLVTKKEILQAKKNLDPKLLEALKIAYQRIYFYHKKQLPKDFSYTDKIGTTLGN